MLKYSFSLIAALLLISSCSSPQKPKEPDAKWKSNMHEFSHRLAEIYPYVTFEEKFNEPENYNTILTHTKRMAALAMDLKNNQKKIKLIDEDPSLGFISESFSKELRTAVDALTEDKKEYARYVLKNSTNYCIQCHTRGQWGPELNNLKDNKNFKNLKQIDRANILFASRNFDKALEVYRSILSSAKFAKDNIYIWEKALKNAVNISVRIKQDPKLTQGIIKQAESNPNISSRLKGQCKNWLNVVYQWKLEKSKGEVLNKYKLLRAGNLIKEANSQSSNDSGKFLVHYLRASALIHDFLRSKPSNSQSAKAYLMLGQCYEKIQQEKFSNMNEFYYKACIHKNPHSKTARKCFANYEASLFSGFQLSDGLAMPPSAIQYMNYLKDLAK